MKISLLRYLLGLSSLALVACGSEDVIDETHFIRSVGIADATALIAADAEGESVLYKVTAQGFVQEVSYFDENGRTLSIIKAPEAVINVNDTYIAILFDNVRSPEEALLVRKADGAAFSLLTPGVEGLKDGYPHFAYGKNPDEVFMADSQGSLYYEGTVHAPFGRRKRLQGNRPDLRGRC
ncbi:MAG: hypothetical protein H6714_00515 [Myxococcales bacterium]|nr:hypothetical protein [Myxococcales bacterium]